LGGFASFLQRYRRDLSEDVMPSFDVVSEIDKHELTNAVDQANREVTTRFDFKDSQAKYEVAENDITLRAQSDFQVKQMHEILLLKLSKRGIDTRCLNFDPIMTSLNEARQKATIKQGIDKEFAKKIVKAIKDANLKVQTSIQGEQIRVSGKKRDDLQTAIALLREAKLDLPLQFVNFRD
jgi:uncharacterized protein YajQ (UPF0234 family)